MSEKTHSEPPKPGALEKELRDTLRTKHYSLKTEESYVGWYRRFVRWHGGQTHPREMGGKEVSAFLTHLAVNRQVAGVRHGRGQSAFCNILLS